MRKSHGKIQVKNRIHLNIAQFLKSTGLWCVGILINLLPILFRCLNAYLDDMNNFSFFNLFWTDQDFLFISFTTGFLLFIEVMFVGNRYKWITNVIGGILLLYTFFSEQWNEHINSNIVIKINICTFACIMILGVLVFLFSAIDFDRRVVKN